MVLSGSTIQSNFASKSAQTMKKASLSKYSLLILFSILLVHTYASTKESLEPVIIHGSVTSKGEPLPFVTVYIKNSTIGTATDAQGKYLLSLLPGTYNLKVQAVGYLPDEMELVTAHQPKMEINFELEQDVIMMDQVTVTGSRMGVLRYLPGSATVVRQDEIRQGMPLSNNEVFGMVPGMHTVEEEGTGLRANIGIRGLDPDRSRNVLMLEDGIPVALGPYGEPEMYYTPAIDRMVGVEVLKGNGQVLYGPQTIGGVINYITADPPAESSGFLSVKGGQGSYFNGLLNYGNTFGNAGFTTTYLRKQAENLGPTRFRLDDLSGKVRVQTGIRSVLNIKYGIYNESSNATYVGLTQAMYDLGGMDDLRIAPDDRLDVRRYSLSAAYDFFINERLTIKTNLFGYTTSRNWLRQDFTYDANAGGLTGIWYGDDSQPEGAIYLRNTTGNRNRQFEVAGTESRIRLKYALLGFTNQIDAGARFLYERAFEQRVNGTTAEALSGILRDDEIRTGKAFSTYVQNKLMLGNRTTLTGGIRLETLDYERKILRLAMKDTTITANTKLHQLIPGAGINHQISQNIGLYAGIHRGFAPPRIKDAISNTGKDIQLEAEKSWNYEAGTRIKIIDVFMAEATVFFMDFSNQVIPVSESSGGAGTGLINGGRTQHRGVEMAFELRLDQLFSEQNKLSIKTNLTWLESVLASDRLVTFRQSMDGVDDKVNVKGNTTPYAPGFLMNSSLTFETARGLGLNLLASYTGSQYTDLLNTRDVETYILMDQNDPDHNYVQATANGRIGEMPGYMIISAGAWYKIGNTGLELSGSVKNLLNERYIVSRRPQGIRVGLARTFVVGLMYNF